MDELAEDARADVAQNALTVSPPSPPGVPGEHFVSAVNRT